MLELFRGKQQPGAATFWSLVVAVRLYKLQILAELLHAEFHRGFLLVMVKQNKVSPSFTVIGYPCQASFKSSKTDFQMLRNSAHIVKSRLQAEANKPPLVQQRLTNKPNIITLRCM